MQVSECLSAMNLLGDESRLRICALLTERELSVGELVRVTGISQSRVSTHLGKLREGGFVRDRREGQHSYYALAEHLPEIAKTLLLETASDALLVSDRKRLAGFDAAQRGGLPEAFAGELEKHYSPGRTWSSLAAGLSALMRLGDVLDVGCADGAAASYLAPRSHSLTCIDTSARMVAAAKKRLGRYPRAQIVLGDVHALPFPEGSFDTVVLFHTLTYVENPKVALAECVRVLRPEGEVVLLSLAAHKHHALTAPYGERTSGFSAKTLRTLLADAGLSTKTCEVVVKEPKKPHFEVILATARLDARPRQTTHRLRPRRTV